jgi:hypothetical protein
MMVITRCSEPLVLGAAVLFLALAPRSASADPARTGVADALFRQAVDLANDGSYEDAAAKFRASYAVEPTLGTLLGLAMAEEQSSRLGSAYAHYRELLDRARASGDAARAAQAQKHLAGLERSVARVVLVCDAPLPKTARIELDGVALPAEAVATPIPVDTGQHVVRVLTDDGALSQTVSVRYGERTQVALRLPPAKPAPVPAMPSATSPMRTLGLVAGGVGGAALLASAVLWLGADGAYADARRVCPGTTCDASAHDALDRGQRLETWSHVGLLVGVVGLASGGTLLILERRGTDVRVAALGRF